MLVAFFEACKSSFPFAINPDKSSFNSGTIGSVRATDDLYTGNNLPSTKDSFVLKMDTTLVKNKFGY